MLFRTLEGGAKFLPVPILHETVIHDFMGAQEES